MESGLQGVSPQWHLWVLSARDGAGTIDLYEFSEDPQTPADVVIANHYTATHPASVFRRTLTIQRVTGDERIAFRGDTLVRSRGGRTTEERIERSQLQQTVREVFGIEMPAGPFVCEGFAVQGAFF